MCLRHGTVCRLSLKRIGNGLRNTLRGFSKTTVVICMPFMPTRSIFTFWFHGRQIGMKRVWQRSLLIVPLALLLITNCGVVSFNGSKPAQLFSVSKKDVSTVCHYIENQKERRDKQSYNEEYAEFLKHYQQTLKNKVNEV